MANMFMGVNRYIGHEGEPSLRKYGLSTSTEPFADWRLNAAQLTRRSLRCCSAWRRSQRWAGPCRGLKKPAGFIPACCRTHTENTVPLMCMSQWLIILNLCMWLLRWAWRSFIWCKISATCWKASIKKAWRAAVRKKTEIPWTSECSDVSKMGRGSFKDFIAILLIWKTSNISSNELGWYESAHVVSKKDDTFFLFSCLLASP